MLCFLWVSLQTKCYKKTERFGIFEKSTIWPIQNSLERNSWSSNWEPVTARKMKFSTKDFLSKCDQIRSFLRIWSHLQKKSFVENFIFNFMNPCQCKNYSFKRIQHSYHLEIGLNGGFPEKRTHLELLNVNIHQNQI